MKRVRDRDVTNLQAWIETFGCISREESKYLWKGDLMAVGPSDPDEFLDTVGSLVEDYIIWVSSLLKKASQYLYYRNFLTPALLLIAQYTDTLGVIIANPKL